jgi:predicted transcriptional regulator
MNGNIKKRILSILKKNPEGLTMLKIAKLVGVHRNTIPKYLYELKGEETVLVRQIGPAKLFYLNDSSLRGTDKQILKNVRRAM